MTTQYVYGVTDSNGIHTDTSATLHGAKIHATKNGYTKVSSRDVNRGAVFLEAVKVEGNWLSADDYEEAEKIKNTITSLNTQLDDAINKCSGMFAEYPLKGGDHLLVLLSKHKVKGTSGIYVQFDIEHPTHFSGDVVVDKEGFYLPFDPEYFEDIYHYLQQIGDEMLEGYLLPNNLYCED